MESKPLALPDEEPKKVGDSPRTWTQLRTGRHCVPGLLVLLLANHPIQGNRANRETKQASQKLSMEAGKRRNGRKMSLSTKEDKYEINDASEMAVLLNSFKICL